MTTPTPISKEAKRAAEENIVDLERRGWLQFSPLEQADRGVLIENEAYRVQSAIDTATAELRAQLAEAQVVDVPSWTLELNPNDLPACQILPDGVRMKMEVFLPWLSKIVRNLANERDALRAHNVTLRDMLDRIEAAGRPHGTDGHGNPCECEMCELYDSLVRLTETASTDHGADTGADTQPKQSL